MEAAEVARLAKEQSRTVLGGEVEGCRELSAASITDLQAQHAALANEHTTSASQACAHEVSH